MTRTKLKKMRQSRGFSQSQFAEKSGMTVRSVQHYEQGVRPFDQARIDVIFRACLALDCTLEDILEKEEYIELARKVLEKSN